MAKGEIVEPRDIIKANNDLFRCKFNLKDIVAGRIFMAFASLVDHRDVKENQSFVEYSIPASSIISNDVDSGEKYVQIREAAHLLLKHTIERPIETTGFRAYTLFSTIEYNKGIIKGEFHKDLVPFFIIAKERFTKMRLDEYMKLPSIYSQSMYGFLKSWSDKDEKTIKVSDLHHMLGSPDSFKRNFADFKKRVLDKAHKDINKLTTLKYDWEAVKVGRSYKEIKFIFHKEIKQRSRQPLTQSTLPDPNAPVQNTVAVSFEKFFQLFPNPGGMDVRLRAWKAWTDLHDSGNAPTADDVPADNESSVIEFLDKWQGAK